MKLVHYTNSTDAINGILKNGLLMNPLERKLIHLFSNSSLFQTREP
jgi:RNA:NAD 2'-phosphotransferase (TPT1/KptA family)